MSKIKKTDLLTLLQEQAEMIVELSSMIKMNKQSIIKLENEREKPQLKQLDQSVFNELDEKWRFAAVDADGTRCDYETKPRLDHAQWACVLGGFRRLVGDYDVSNWQNSLIERDTAKELIEVDLSSELTGSDLCRAMLARGDKYVMCLASDDSQADTLLDDCGAAISSITDNGCFYGYDFTWLYVTPINNQGEPLTQSDVGL